MDDVATGTRPFEVEVSQAEIDDLRRPHPGDPLAAELRAAFSSLREGRSS